MPNTIEDINKEDKQWESDVKSMIMSDRGPYIQAKALYIAYSYLDSIEDIEKRQESDIRDMLDILYYNYPNFLRVFRQCEEWGIQI